MYLVGKTKQEREFYHFFYSSLYLLSLFLIGYSVSRLSLPHVTAFLAFAYAFNFLKEKTGIRL